MTERNSHVAEPFRQIINDISASTNSTDIVERLRRRIMFRNDADALEAADEIVRLREEVATWKERYEAERHDHEATIKTWNETLQD